MSCLKIIKEIKEIEKIFEILVDIFFYNYREKNCQPEKNKKLDRNLYEGVLYMKNFVIKNDKIGCII